MKTEMEMRMVSLRRSLGVVDSIRSTLTKLSFAVGDALSSVAEPRWDEG